jgi:ribonuclease HII
MPSFRYELRVHEQHAGQLQPGQPGSLCIAGIDEVGRGPLAGPVVAAVAVIDRTLAKRKLLRLIDDSKKLVREDRETAYEAMIAAGCVRFAVGEASVEEIDTVNILQATFLAMRRALAGLTAAPPDIVLIDGNQIPPELGCKAETIIGGDARSYSIAAASIFAKVTRDRYMCRLAETFPGYGWETNVGYKSPAHLRALKALGPTPHHRRSFAPVRACLGEAVPAEALLEEAAIAEEINDQA